MKEIKTKEELREALRESYLRRMQPPPNPLVEQQRRRRELESLHISKVPLTHRGLCEIGRRLLLRKSVFDLRKAWSEIQAGHSSEIADAYGIDSYMSILIEVKMSLSDFKADSKKPHRQAGKGVGDYRYYMAPKGLLSIDILPEKWGLIEVDDKRRCNVIIGHLTECNYEDKKNKWKHNVDVNAERSLLLWKM